MPLPEEFHELARRVRNWGRWGPDDERGTVNLLTPDVVRRGVAAVKTGRPLSLAITLSQKSPQTGWMPGRLNPLRTMLQVNHPFSDPDGIRTNDDLVVMGLQAATHWDALSHVSYGGHLWNGHPASSVDAHGARRCGIDKIGTLTGRGVLLDVARARGVAVLEPGHAITGEDLDAAEELAHVRVEPGDIALVRTGQIRRFHAGDREGYAFPAAGLAMASAPWLRDHDVAAVATDSLALEVIPGEIDGLFLPVHLLHLVEMGLTQGQNFDLEALSEACAERGSGAFLLEASPEPFFRAVGAPVNPVAIL